MTNSNWQSYVQTNHALPIYKQFWNGCEVIENDKNGETEETAEILDFGDVDKIIRIHGKQIHMAQRFRKPWPRHDPTNDPDFTLRLSRPTSSNIIEHERLMNSHGDPTAAYPRCYAFGRVYDDHTRGLYELYILDTDGLIAGIKSGQIEERGPRTTDEGQRFYYYDLQDIRGADAIIKEWNEKGQTRIA